MKPTNLTRMLDARKVPYTAFELPNEKLGALEAAQHLGVSPELVYKTIVVTREGRGKPVLAVPTEGQFEQTLNAWDAERVGVARAGGYEDLDDFWAHRGPPDPAKVADFQAWVARAPELLVDAVERTARQGPTGQAAPPRSNRATG